MSDKRFANDIARCPGSDCPVRETCARFRGWGDPGRVVRMVPVGVGPDGCGLRIQVEEVDVDAALAAFDAAHPDLTIDVDGYIQSLRGEDDDG